MRGRQMEVLGRSVLLPLREQETVLSVSLGDWNVGGLY